MKSPVSEIKCAEISIFYLLFFCSLLFILSSFDKISVQNSAGGMLICL